MNDSTVLGASEFKAKCLGLDEVARCHGLRLMTADAQIRRRGRVALV
jgi:hypothetical protein